jgi:hypothetical protein
MSASDHPRLTRFLSGYSTPDEMQEPPGPAGDPQLTALTQFLQTLGGALGRDDVILDIGSGRGILAHSLLNIWTEDAVRPWYYAVDREEVLDKLSLPRAIHNHSQKVPFAEFIEGRLPCQPQEVKVGVLRNILHELDIRTTAEVLVALSKIAKLGGQVYLQDIVSLPKGERENAGWPSDLLRMVLEGLGFDCGSPVLQSSRSGTEWFTMILKQKLGHSVLSVPDATRLVADGREQQRQRRTTRLAELGDNQETLPEYIMLSTEVAALALQLQQHRYTATTQIAGTRIIADLPLLPLPASPLDYVEEMPASTQARSGLRGILSSKNFIDLPALLRTAVSRLWFAGYSERLLFNIPEVRASLIDAGLRGVDIRMLLVDPDSPAAQARSVSDAYAKPEDLFDDIRTTIVGFAEFDEALGIAVTADTPEIQCTLRLCTSMLSSSFFFVDDLCICSLYSASLTGGAGAAFVFRSSSVQPNGYFQVLLREFQSAWANCEGRALQTGPSE